MPYSPYKKYGGRLKPNFSIVAPVLHIESQLKLLAEGLRNNVTRLRLRLDHQFYRNLMYDDGGEMVLQLLEVPLKYFPAVKLVELVGVQRWELGRSERILARLYKQVVDYVMSREEELRFEMVWWGYDRN
jgi:hypothetical protein